LAGHAHIESYAILTRLPAAHRRHQETVMRLLAHNFPATVHLPADIAMDAVRQLAERGIAGGAAYDGLVALAARHHHLPLLTCDERARATYDAFGVEVEVEVEVEVP